VDTLLKREVKEFEISLTHPEIRRLAKTLIKIPVINRKTMVIINVINKKVIKNNVIIKFK